MNIKIESTELKSLLEKVLPQVAKKAKMPVLECVLLESKNNILTATATDIDSYLSVYTSKYNCLSDGKILIHSDDVKLISKLSGEIEIVLNNDKEIIFKTGKKSISVTNHDVTMFPETMNNINRVDFTPIVTVKENSFLTAITKSNYFVSDNENNPMLQYYNLNLKAGRIEALDGHRISVIDLEINKQSEDSNVLIHSFINTKLKKVLSIKSTDTLQISKYKINTSHYIVIKGTDFIYLQREKEGEYFKIDQFLSADYDLSMTVNTKDLLDISKFDLDMVDKNSKKPIVINYDNSTDNTYIYLNSGKYKTLDKLETINTNMNNKDFMIGFDPKFIYEAMKCIDDEQILIKMQNSKAPAIIYAEGEKYIILPVYLAQIEREETIKEYIKQVAA